MVGPRRAFLFRVNCGRVAVPTSTNNTERGQENEYDNLEPSICISIID
jgi:hypothetical protein